MFRNVSFLLLLLQILLYTFPMTGLETSHKISQQLMFPFNRLYGMFDLANPNAHSKTSPETLGLISDAQKMYNVASASGPNGESGYGVRFLGTNGSYAIIDDPNNRVSINIKAWSYEYWYFHMRPWQGHRGTVFSMLATTSSNEPIGIFTVSYDGDSTLTVEWRKSITDSSPLTCSFTGCIRPNVWNQISNSIEFYIFLVSLFIF